MGFRHDDIETFRVADYDIDPRSGEVRLRYLLGHDHRFEERVAFGTPTSALSGERLAGFESCIRLLHLAAGVSYYKAAAPPDLVVATGGLRPAEATLVADLYDKGLREFAFRNGLDRFVPPRITAPGSPPVPAAAPPEAGIAVPIGGGKDSIVVLEALRSDRPVLVSVNPGPAARRVATVADLPLIVVERHLDPYLFELNAAGALNGHVPVTAIVSLIVVAAGYMAGFDTTVMALESSADEPTRVVRDASGAAVAVNHQWSKSTECERELAAVLAESVNPAVRYLSPLRNVGELDITRAFAALDRYHAGFRSCNGAFRLSGAQDSWCRHCPKCRFVYLALATSLGPNELFAIFGGDMLADLDQREGFAALLDPEAKPFECVGTREEVAEALRMVASDPRWREAPVVRALAGPAATDVDAPAVVDEGSVFDEVRAVVHGTRSL